MKKLARVFRGCALLTLVLVVSTCVTLAPNAPEAGQGPPFDAPGSVMTFHVDTSFTGPERDALQEAVNNLQAQTRGLLVARLIFDLDFNDIESLVVHRHEDILLRITSDSSKVDGYDSSTSKLLGLTEQRDDGLTWVYIVADRLPEHRLFVAVTMHELLHAFGLGHVQEFGIMGAHANRHYVSNCLHAADVEEVCRVYGCQPKRIGWCVD